MRFGIMANQLGLLVPADISDDGQSISNYLANFSMASLVSRLADQGFSVIELNPDLELFFPGCYGTRALDALATLKQERGLTYTCHLPLWSTDPSMPDARVRQASVEVLVDAARRLSVLDPEVFVFHATGPLAMEFSAMALPDIARSFVLATFQARARESLATLLEQTGLPPRRIAVENIGFPLDLTASLAEEFDCSVCLDTGHVLAGYCGDFRLQEALDRFLPRLAEVHLHDGYRRNHPEAPSVKDHLRLGRGDLPYARLLDDLETAGFEGPVIFELEVDDALASLAAIRDVWPGLERRPKSVLHL